MKQMFVLALSLFLLSASALAGGVELAQATRPATANNIDLKTETDIADAYGVSIRLSAMTERVTACIDKGGAAKNCQCQYPADLKALKDATAAALGKHPDWKDKVVNFKANSRSIAVSFPGLEKQFATCPQ